MFELKLARIRELLECWIIHHLNPFINFQPFWALFFHLKSKIVCAKRNTHTIKGKNIRKTKIWGQAKITKFQKNTDDAISRKWTEYLLKIGSIHIHILYFFQTNFHEYWQFLPIFLLRHCPDTLCILLKKCRKLCMSDNFVNNCNVCKFEFEFEKNVMHYAM